MKHLIFVQHGMFGMSYFFDNFKKKIELAINDSIVILPKDNNFLNSLFGTQICGDKLVKIVYNTLEQYPEAETISFIGHSFGGILGRYVIGILERDGIFETIKPLAYISISTPHIGVVTNKSIVKFGLKHVTGITGKELIGNLPMLETLSKKDSDYFKGLEKFKLKLLYGNLFNDDVIAKSACLYTNNHVQNLIEIVPKRLYLICESDNKSENKSDLLNMANISNISNIANISVDDFIGQYADHHQIIDTNDDCPFSDIKKLNWIRKVADFSEYLNSHITIVGRHTFIPFLQIHSSEASIVILDIICELTKVI